MPYLTPPAYPTVLPFIDPLAIPAAQPLTTSFQVENYFAEQPSGRHLLHVLPQRVSAQNRQAPHGPAAGRSTLGNLREAPSGRGLVQDALSDVSSSQGPEIRGEVELSSEASGDESSRWDDSDAQSRLPYTASPGAYETTDAASVYRSSEAGESGIYRQAAAAAPNSATAAEDQRATFGVRGLTESDFDVSEGSEVDSRVPYGSELTYGHDTAAGGSSVYAMSYGERASGAPWSRVPGQQQETLQQHGSSQSSFASRTGYSEYTASSLAGRPLVGQGSWRMNSPAARVQSEVHVSSHPPPIPPGSSGESSDPGALMRQSGQRFERNDSRQSDDSEFGATWLENRAHTRRYDAQGRS